ncbi:MAG: transposase [Alcanivoracaceae bacterium]|nr:transposase [Alcanivoracaceae bacterium]
MTRPRSQQVSLDATPYYHCICRCVRRAFLCGRDNYSGTDYEHRRQWVVERLAVLVEVFSIDLCAYAVMSNHYHVVLRIDQERAQSWSDAEVARRWLMLFSGPMLVQRWLKGSADKAQSEAALEIIQQWRARLTDLGWFMKCLNEHLARRANEEDSCKGRFWESRYKSQALLDETALLACMAYVDLNPVRAKMAKAPEDSEFTSIQQRAEALKQSAPSDVSESPKPKLLAFVSAENIDAPWKESLCEVRLMDYLELVDQTGRAIRENKRGQIDAGAASILQRLSIDPETWLRHMQPRRNRLLSAMGSAASIANFIVQTGRQRLLDKRAASALHS